MENTVILTRRRSLIIDCPAKLNLFLAVLGRRPDGYHNLATIMQSISLSDTLSCVFNPTHNEIRIRCQYPNVPIDERNLAVKAINALAAILGRKPAGKMTSPWPFGIEITIQKRIPVGAGLGGGSSDAAGILRALTGIVGAKNSQLTAAANAIGSDVAFCLKGGTRWCSSRGDIVGRNMPGVGFPFYILVSPGYEVSTAGVYHALRLKKKPEKNMEPNLKELRKIFRLFTKRC